ncbi:MAG: 3-oxoacyl-[acyl-carrier-protein] synthase-3 [Yoonia sp.]|jgi:3-oxoacyl-[acyl-carrier-protein] synthase-3
MIRIAGTGRALSAKCVTSDMPDKRLGRKVPWFSATGLKVHYVCEDEAQVDLAVVAC